MQKISPDGAHNKLVVSRTKLGETSSADNNGHCGKISLPKEILEASVPGPCGEEDYRYDVCVIRTTLKRGSRSLRDLEFDETSPLLVNQRKQGFADDHHTFPKRVAMGDEVNELEGNSDETLVSWLPSNNDSHNFAPEETNESGTERKKEKVGLWKVTQIICLIALLPIMAVIACGIFYILSTCPAPTQTTNRKQVCSSQYHFLSTCSFSCPPGFVLQGKPKVKCGINRRWSDPIPTCQCPACSTGPQCQYSIDWNKVEGQVATALPGVYKMIHYGNRTINCVAEWDFLWDCQCLDVQSHNVAACTHLKSLSGSCIHSLANLIDKMVKSGAYPAPCNNAHNFNQSLSCQHP